MRMICHQLFTLLFAFGLLTQIECQLIGQGSCTEFKSPKLLETVGSTVGTLGVPLTSSKYSRNQICEWIITTEDKNDIVQLQVKICNLEGKDIYGECNTDYVDIFNVQNEQPLFLGRFCSHEVGKIYESTGAQMVVKFHSNEANEFSGFWASYQAVKPENSKSDKNTFLQLSVGIPVAVLVIVIVISFVIAMVRVYRNKKAAAAGQRPVTISNEGRLVALPRVTGRNSDIAPFVSSPAVRTSSRSAGSTDHSYETGNVPLHSALPAYIHEDAELPRSRTPPPAYDTLGYDTCDLGPHGIAITPPPYEMIVKENAGQSSSA